MVRDINGLGSYNSPKSVTEQGGKTSSPSTAAASTQAGSQEPGEAVQLSAEAKTLQSLADKVNSLPDVNLARAEQIKAALENGEYQVNDLVLADKILNSEALLSG